jgi:maltose O-acetyltransferase
LLRRWRNRIVTAVRGDSDDHRLRRGGAQIGEKVFINGSARLDAGFLWLISIGDGTVIGPAVHILAHDATTRRRLGYSIVAPVAIGRRVFIGAGSIVMPGVTIGDDAIIGAGSVVRDDVPPGVLAIGNPVQIVSSTDEYLAKHRERMSARPCWPRDGWTLEGGITAAHQRAMREALAEGPAYVE